MKSPKELWDTLEQYFNNVHKALLRIIDESGANLICTLRECGGLQSTHPYRADIQFDGVEKSDWDFPLNAFPVGASVIVHQLRVAYKEGGIKIYGDLISLLEKKERHHGII